MRLIENKRTNAEMMATAQRDAMLGSARAQELARAQTSNKTTVSGLYQYTVVSGDTLGIIARDRYGAWQAFPDIWAINHTNRGGPLGDNPNLINVGDVLTLADTRSELETESRLTAAQRQAIIDGTAALPLPSEMSATELAAPAGIEPPIPGFIRGTLLTPKGAIIGAVIIGTILGARKLIKARG
jgi:hypothetical protein